MENELQQAVFEAAKRADVRDAVSAVYASLQAQVDLRRPICKTSGRCCRFEEFGHRMYVTTMELAKFVADWVPGLKAACDDQTRLRIGLPVLSIQPRGCPFQIDGLCSVHAIRPFGCRVFFCDATAQQWQQEQYEQHHSHLRRLHDQLGVDYFYVEWRTALEALELSPIG